MESSAGFAHPTISLFLGIILGFIIAGRFPLANTISILLLFEMIPAMLISAVIIETFFYNTFHYFGGAYMSLILRDLYGEAVCLLRTYQYIPILSYFKGKLLKIEFFNSEKYPNETLNIYYKPKLIRILDNGGLLQYSVFTSDKHDRQYIMNDRQGIEVYRIEKKKAGEVIGNAKKNLELRDKILFFTISGLLIANEWTSRFYPDT